MTLSRASQTFLSALLGAVGPSGAEQAPAHVWRARAEQFAEVTSDSLGSSFARVHGGPRTLAVFGHLDEVGLVVTDVDDAGYIRFSLVGDWTPAVVAGQRIRLLTSRGVVVGVVGNAPPHLRSGDEGREQPLREGDLWIDIGASSGDDARANVRVGDAGVIDQPRLELLRSRVASRALDNRAGAFAALEAARIYSGDRGDWSLVAVASVQEETSYTGAYAAAYRIQPDAAIAVDVTHTSDHPSADARKTGDIRLGGGPVIARGSGVHRDLSEFVISAAAAEGIAHQLEAAGGHTYTDADAVRLTRTGVPTAVISIPNRYMHSPSEVIDLRDLEATAALVAAVARRLEGVPGEASFDHGQPEPE